MEGERRTNVGVEGSFVEIRDDLLDGGNRAVPIKDSMISFRRHGEICGFLHHGGVWDTMAGFLTS